VCGRSAFGFSIKIQEKNNASVLSKDVYMNLSFLLLVKTQLPSGHMRASDGIDIELARDLMS
jgi:hypothetical protein